MVNKISVQISNKKQVLFLIILICTNLIIIEGFLKLNDYLYPSCKFIHHELFKELNFSDKYSICKEYHKDIKFDFNDSIKRPLQQDGFFLNINSDGFRGKEIDFKTDSYKIFFVGGSTAFGFVSLSDDMTIPSILEEKLRDDGFNVQVINAGVPSASSIDGRYYIEKYIVNYNPDMIITYDGWNDVMSPWKNIPYEKFKNQSYFTNNNLAESKGSGLGIIKFLVNIDYKTGLGAIAVINNMINHNFLNSSNFKEKNSIYGDYSIEYQKDVENHLQTNWANICELGLRNNFETINVLQPILGTGDKEFSNYEGYSEKSTNEYLISFELNEVKYSPCTNVYDFRNVFDEFDNITIYFDDGHVTDFGNEIIAERMYQKISPMIKME